MHSSGVTRRELKLQWRTLQYWPAPSPNRQPSARMQSSLSPVKAGVSAGQSKRTMTPPGAAIWQRYVSRHPPLSATAVVVDTASASTPCQATRESAAARRAARRRAPCSVPGAHRRRCVPRLLGPWRVAGSRVPLVQSNATHRSSRVRPNPSFKPSPNGVPPGPGHGYRVHFPWPGPGGTPLVPA